MKDVSALLESIDLEQIELNIFRGVSHDVGTPQVFGGQVLSQSLHAAMLTVEPDRMLHSMHGYFILPGDLRKPILFDVDRLRDGRSFTTRRVVAIQNGAAIFNLSASFQIREEGLVHQIDMPDVEGPENLPSDQELLNAMKDKLPESFRRYARPRPVEFRPINPLSFVTPQKQEPFRFVWMKANGAIPDDQRVHQRILAYASDYNLLSTAMLPHQDRVMLPQLQMASLDHAMWYHEELRMDEWLLYALDSPSASNARGFTRGSVFARDGKLLASVTQEGLIRKRFKSAK